MTAHASALGLLATAPSPLWFLDRSAGEVTLVLMSVAMILGIVRSAVPTAYPVSVEGAHANIALLTLGFAGLHVLASVLDPFARLGPVDVFVPFVSAYRGTWLGLGVASGYLYGVSVIVSWPARRLPRPVWIWLHRTMYAAWVLAIMHSLGTGSDVQNQVFLLLNVSAVACVLAVFLAVRVAEGVRQLPLVWSAAGLVAILVVLALTAWAVNGPLQSGWARSSGTPPDLLRSP